MRRSRTTTTILAAAVSAAAAALAAAPLFGQTAATWDGGGDHYNWSDPLNWVGDAAPASGQAGLSVVLSGNAFTTSQQNVANPFVLQSLVFDAAAGPFALSGNQVQFSASGALLDVQTAAAVSVLNPIQLVGGTEVRHGVAAGATATLAGPIGGGGSLVKTGAGTVVLAGSNTYAGGTFVQGGVLQGNATSLRGTITDNAQVVFDQATADTFAGAIGGTGSVVKANAGALFLAGANTFTGGTVVDAGYLYLAASERLADGGAVTVNNGAGFGLNGYTETVGAVTLNDGTIDGGNLVASSYSVANGSVGANLGGAGGLTKTGTGTVLLTGTNTYAGATTVTAGVLKLASAGSNVGAVNVAGGTLDLGGYSRTATGAVSLTGGSIENGVLTATAYSVTAGSVGASLYGAGGLAKTGPGTAVLSGYNNYSGGTTVAGGTLQGTTNGLQGAIANNAKVVFDQAFTGYYFGTISGGGSVAKTGPGTVYFYVPQAYTGGTTVDQGTLYTASADVLPDIGPLVVSGGAVALGGADTTGPLTLDGNGRVTGSGPLTAPAYALKSGTVDVGLAGSAGVVKLGTGTVTLSGANTYSGGTTVLGGTLIGNTSSLRGNIANNGEVQFDQSYTDTYAGVISGPGAVTKSSFGTLVVAAPQAYTGTTTVAAGALLLGGSERLMDGSALVVNGGSFDLGGYAETVAQATLNAGVLSGGTLTAAGGFTVNSGYVYADLAGGGGLTKSGTGAAYLYGTSGATAGTTVGDGSLTLMAPERLPDNAPLAVSGGTLSLGGYTERVGTLLLTGGTVAAGTLTANSYLVQAGTISAALSGSGGLAKTGTGAVTLTGANTYAGGTTVGAGTLVGNTSSLRGTITNNAEVVFDQSFTDTLAGTIGGSGSVTKANVGTLVVATAQAYTGGTTVVGGALQLGAAERLADTGALNVAGGAFDLTGFTETVGPVTFDGGAITNGTLVGSSYSVSSGGIDAVLAGTGTLTKTGAGTVNLYAANTYTGGTVVAEGRLSLLNNERLADAAPVTVSGGDLFVNLETIGTLHLVSGRVLGSWLYAASMQVESGTLGVSLVGSGSLTKTGSGTVTLSGSNAYSAGTMVLGGTLECSPGALQGIVTNNGQIVFNQTSDGTFTGSIGGSGSVTKTGPRPLYLATANTYTGGTTISSGTLVLGAAERLADNGPLAVNPGTIFDLGGFTETVGAVTLDGGVIQNGTLAAAAVDLRNGSIYARLVGNGGLTKTGTGSAVLASSNTYTGGTTVAGGILYLYAADTLADNGPVTVSGGTLSLSAGGSEVVGPVKLISGSIEGSPLTGSSYEVQSGTISAALTGTGTLTKTGTGTVTLNTAASYAGGTVVQAGTLDLSNSTLATTGDVTVTGGTLSLGGNARSVGALLVTGGALTNGTLTGTGYAVQGGSVSAVLAGSAALTKTGTGTAIVAGANTYTGGTTIADGTLLLGAGERLANGRPLGVTGGTFDLGGFAETVGAVSMTGGAIANGTLTGTSYALDAGTVTATLAGTASLVKGGTGTLVLTGANTYSGGTTVSNGILQGNTTSLKGTITNNGQVLFDQSASATFAGVIGGTGSLVKANVGILTLTGANTYAGGTIVNGGALRVGTSNVQGNVTVGGGGQLIFDQTTSGTFAGTISGPGSVLKSGTGTVTLSGANAYAGGSTVSGGTLRGDTQSLVGAIVDNAVVAFDQSFDGTYAGAIAGSGSLSKAGAGVVTMSGVNTYTGGTTVTGGALRISSASLQGAITDNALLIFEQPADGTYAGSIGGTGSVNKAGTGVLVLTGSNTYAGGTTVLAGTIRGSASSLQGGIVNNAQVVFDDASAGTYAGSITGTGSLLKLGSGVLTLTGSNAHTGGTVVGAGALRLGTANLQGAITDNAQVIFDQAASGTYAGTIGGTGSVVKAGAGTVTLTGANTYSGGTTVSAGVLRVTTSSLPGDATTAAQLAFDQSFDGTYGGSVGGAGGLAKSGPGAVTLGGVQTYAGPTTVTGGTLRWGRAGVLPAANSVSIAGGVLDLGPYAATFAGIDLSAGQVTGGGPVTVTGTYGQTGGSFGATIQNLGAFTYAGGAFPGSLVNWADATVNADFAPGQGVQNSGRLTVGAGRTVTLGGAGLTSDGTVDFGGAATLAGPGGLTNYGLIRQGAGVLTLSAAGNNVNFGNVDLAAGYQFRIVSGLSNQGTINVNGTAIAGTGSLTNGVGGVVAGRGVISAAFANAAGGVVAPAGGTLSVTQPFANAGTVRLAGPLGSLAGGAVANAGSIEGHGNVANAVTNTGTIAASGGTLQFGGPVTNAATGRVSTPAGARVLFAGGVVNAGSIDLAGGAVDAGNLPLTNAGRITGSGQLASGGLTNSGQVQLSAGATTVQGPVTNAVGGTIAVSGGGVVTFYGPLANQAGAEVRVGTASTAVFYGPLSGGGTVTGGGTKSFEAGVSSVGTVAATGTTVVEPAATLIADTYDEGTVVARGRVAMRSGGTSVVRSLTLEDGGTFDVGSGALVLDYAGPSPSARVVAQIAGAFAGGTWAGSGITSSSAAGDAARVTGLGWAEASVVGAATFGGVGTDATALLIRYTYLGDANLDGRVTADDYALVDKGMAAHLTGWVFGDFDYDGSVTLSDYLLIDRAFLQRAGGGGSPAPSLLADREARFGPAYVTELLASVPEPSSRLGLTGAAAPCLAGRRRRRR